MKKIIFFISVVTAFFILWTYQKSFTDNTPVATPNNHSLSATKGREAAPVSSDKKSLHDDVDVSTQSVSARGKSEQLLYSPLTEQDIEETRAWMEKRELDEYARNLYSSYDESVLTELADQGDVVAIKQLYHRSMQELMDASQVSGAEMTAAYIQWQQQLFDKVDKYVYSAILHGDRESLAHGERLFQRYSGAGFDPDTRAMTLDSLAFYEFANIRGDVMLGHIGTEGATRQFERTHGPLQLSAAEKTAIQNRARQIHDEVENKRIELGLGPFDNSVSAWELKRVELMRQRQEGMD